jgi:hypothetical protein
LVGAVPPLTLSLSLFSRNPATRVRATVIKSSESNVRKNKRGKVREKDADEESAKIKG